MTNEELAKWCDQNQKHHESMASEYQETATGWLSHGYEYHARLAAYFRECAAALRAADKAQEDAEIGRRFMDKMHEHAPNYSWSECPTEWVITLLDRIDELEEKLK